jgi:hypothetical protein
MAIIRQKSRNNSVNSPEKLAPQPIEAERMHDIQLLLQNLFNSEEATIKLIIDCLYDIGSVNLINQKLRFRPLNRVIKLIAKMSKPVFRVFAWYWFKQNCPQLITNWLQSKVSFEYPIEKPTEIDIEVTEIQLHPPLSAETLSQEVKYLRYQIRLLMGISIAALLALGLVITTLNRTPEIPIESRQQTK